MKHENDDAVWFRYDAEWFRYVGVTFGIALVLILLLHVLPLVLQVSYDVKPFVRAAVTYISYANPYLSIVGVVIMLLALDRFMVQGSLKNKQKKRRGGMKKAFLIAGIAFGVFSFFAEPSFSAEASLDQLNLPPDYMVWPHGKVNYCDANGKQIVTNLYGKFDQITKELSIVTLVRVGDEHILVSVMRGQKTSSAMINEYLPSITGVTVYNGLNPGNAKKLSGLLSERMQKVLGMTEKEISDLFMFTCLPEYNQIDFFAGSIFRKESK